MLIVPEGTSASYEQDPPKTVLILVASLSVCLLFLLAPQACV